MFKNSIFLLLSFLYPLLGKADCAGSGIEFWPRNNFIFPSGPILITAYASSQKILNDQTSTHFIYLLADKDSVPLKKHQFHKGEFQISQALFFPSKPLTPGKTYSLFIASQTMLPTIQTRWNNELLRYDTIQWTVFSKIDSIAPKWIEKPKEINKSFQLYGCGQSKFVHFSTKVKEDSDFLIQVEVCSKTSQKCTLFYLIPKASEIFVGHDMCSGPYAFTEGNLYSISMALIDAAGNVTKWKGKKLEFIRPSILNGK